MSWTVLVLVSYVQVVRATYGQQFLHLGKYSGWKAKYVMPELK